MPAIRASQGVHADDTGSTSIRQGRVTVARRTAKAKAPPVYGGAQIFVIMAAAFQASAFCMYVSGRVHLFAFAGALRMPASMQAL